MNGMQLLENIRKINKRVPFLIISAFSESSLLLKAFNLNASHYALKPVNPRDLILKVQELCEAKKSRILLEEQKRNLEEFLNTVNKVAIISTADEQGLITYANENFCDISGYNEQELLGNSHNIVRHPDVPASIFKQMWKTIGSGNIWKGKIKNRAKDGSSYYVNATIIPSHDIDGKNIVEYIGIRFLTTQEDTQKREFKKRVINNVKETRQYKQEVNQRIKELESQLQRYHHVHLIEESFIKQKVKNKELLNQINAYEEEIKELKDRYEENIFKINEDAAEIRYEARSLKNDNEYLKQQVGRLEYDNKAKKNEINRLNDEILEQKEYIKDLKDVIKHREEELGLA